MSPGQATIAARQRIAAVGQVDQRQTAEVETKYMDLVKRLAHGQEIAPEKILADLREWGKQTEQLQRDVEAVAERIDASVIAKTLPKATQDYNRLVDKKRAIEERQLAEWRALQEKHQADRLAIDAELRTAYRAFQAATEAADMLRSGATGPAVDRLNDIKRRWALANARLGPAGKNLAAAEFQVQRSFELEKATGQERPLLGPSMDGRNPIEVKKQLAQEEYQKALAEQNAVKQQFDEIDAELKLAERALEDPLAFAPTPPPEE